MSQLTPRSLYNLTKPPRLNRVRIVQCPSPDKSVLSDVWQTAIPNRPAPFRCQY